MAWESFDNIKGPKGDKGDAGTVGSVSIAAVAPEAPASATLTGTEDVHMHLEIPRGEKGERGPAGVASSASAEAVPYGQPPEVILSQEGELVHARFKVPTGAPGVNAVPAAEAVGTYLGEASSPSRDGLKQGMQQVAADPTSPFAVDQKAKLDAGLAGKANLVAGKVPDAEIGASTAATVGTIPKRSVAGRLPGIGVPTAASEATPKSYVDDGITTAVAPVSGQVNAMQGVMLTKDDLMLTTIISGVPDLATVASETTFSHYNEFFVAPFPLRILSAQIMFSRVQETYTATKYWNLTLRRLRANVGANIVEKSTFAEQPLQRTAWNFDGATWNETNRVLQAGDGLAFGGSVAGGGKISYPVAVTVRFARV